MHANVSSVHCPRAAHYCDRKAIARCIGNCFSGCHSNTYKIYHDADISAIGLELSSIDYK